MTLQFKAPVAATSPAAKAQLVWKPLDVDSLPKDLRSAYEAWREADEVAKALKKSFTGAFRDCVVAPTGTQAVLGYLYGKLSYAFAPIKTSRAVTNAIDFRTLLK